MYLVHSRYSAAITGILKVTPEIACGAGVRRAWRGVEVGKDNILLTVMPLLIGLLDQILYQCPHRVLCARRGEDRIKSLRALNAVVQPPSRGCCGCFDYVKTVNHQPNDSTAHPLCRFVDSELVGTSRVSFF